jgi:Fis family transcriptional regulator
VTGPQHPAPESAKADGPLCESVRRCVRQYLAELDGEASTDFYQLVLSQVEAPLLEEVMRHTRNNQTRAARLLGLNRGTLRKKLQLHGIAGGD